MHGCWWRWTNEGGLHALVCGSIVVSSGHDTSHASYAVTPTPPLESVPAKRRLERVFHAFAADADFALRFQPFQLYGDLPAEGGVDKGAFFLANSKRVRPDESDAERARRRQGFCSFPDSPTRIS